MACEFGITRAPTGIRGAAGRGVAGRLVGARLVAHAAHEIKRGLLFQHPRRIGGIKPRLGHHDGGQAVLAAQLFDPGAWPRVEALVAEHAGAIVGYALFYGCYSSFRGQPVIWLEDLCVTAESRSSGAGFALMRSLAALAVERNCARVAWDVLNWNEPSIAFYERLGAVRDQGWHGYSLAGVPLENLGRSR